MTTASPFTATAAGARAQLYAHLTAEAPVARATLPSGAPIWLVTRYETVRRVLNDPALTKAPSALGRLVAQSRPDLLPYFAAHVLAADGEEHARRRRLVVTAFSRRAVERLEPRVRELAQSLLDELDPGDPDAVVDLFEGYAYPLPMAVICELLGMPVEVRERFHELVVKIWTHGMFIPADELGAALDEQLALVQSVIEAKRAEPDEALISALVAARDGEHRLTEEELTSMVNLLAVAGHETTSNLLANGTAALLAHPDQLARLRTDPDLLPTAVEELLRFATPVQTAFPVVSAADVQLDGVTIPAGEAIFPAVLAANRDPRFVDEPDVLDITRTSKPNLGFGHGPHHCLGVSLARLEARIGFATLLERYPDLSLAVDPSELTWQANVMFHGLSALPVRLGKPA